MKCLHMCTYVLYSTVWCRYGVGYHMVVVKAASCVSSRVVQIVTSMVSGSKNVTDVGTELSFILPSTSSHHFPELFEKLECKEYIVCGHCTRSSIYYILQCMSNVFCIPNNPHIIYLYHTTCTNIACTIAVAFKPCILTTCLSL